MPQENFPLKNVTTFHIGGPARFFFQVRNESELRAALAFVKEKSLPVLILGGGSNMLVSDRGYDGVVIQIHFSGIEQIDEQDDVVRIKIAAGEQWDTFVAKAIENGWHGIENLSNIPGRIGAVAMQNVGAYGQEASEVVESVEVLDLKDDEIKTLTNEQCGFRYRASIFNSEEKGRYIILAINFLLKRKAEARLDYPDVKKYFEEKNIAEPSLQEVREAIIAIRAKKFPPLDEAGSSGSFFKNLVLTEEQFAELKQKSSAFMTEDELAKLDDFRTRFATPQGIKIPTAFIIDRLGLKGMQVGGARVHDQHALVIINATGSATAQDVLDLFKKIRQIVHEKTGMAIVNEPEFVGFTKEELESAFELTDELTES